MTRNYTKSFNSKSRDARKYPITLIDFLRYTLQDWFVKWRDLAVKCNGLLATNIEKELCGAFETTTSMIVHTLSRFEFYVQDGDKDGDVNLQNKTCSYKVFDLIGLPCVHALATACNWYIDIYTLCSKLEQLVYQTFILVHENIITPLEMNKIVDQIMTSLIKALTN